MIVRKFGETPLCNGRPERAPHIGSFCFPLCWRCTSIIAGYSVCYWTKPVFLSSHIILGLIISIGLIIPCAYDGVRQVLSDYESSNPLRIITGLLAGIGMSILGFVFYGCINGR